ncbi:MAG: T9SS type A sorting domain-containing protein [Sphingobacteriaceae bacterium]|nr:T9SS type A sorting domain-containing protein [Sphingobacteriaceae bacterium]
MELNENIEKPEIAIYNSIGQLVCKNSLKEGINTIDISKFSSGYYYSVITSNGEKIHNEKIIVE